MCRDHSRFYDLQQIYSYYDLEQFPELEFEPVYHEIAGTSSLWPIVVTKDGKRQIISAVWGIMPWYAKTRKEADAYKVKMVNARQETIFESNTYKYSITKSRCIIPSPGFYEHHHEIGGKRKIPYFIRVRDTELFSLAGIYSNWVDKETGELITSFSVITTAANELMAKIHNGGENSGRMPLMLEKEMLSEWLDPATPVERVKEILNYKIESKTLMAHPVFTIRGKNRLEGAAVIEECAYPDYTLDLSQG
jgi:putative SOS response-associated peptidase YedK